MKPSQLASQLRRIAAAIDNSKKPDRTLVARDLKKVLAGLTPDTRRIASSVFYSIKDDIIRDLDLYRKLTRMSHGELETEFQNIIRSIGADVTDWESSSLIIESNDPKVVQDTISDIQNGLHPTASSRLVDLMNAYELDTSNVEEQEQS